MDTVDVPSEESPHRQAAAFARRVRDRSIEAIEDLLLFGSTAHGDRSGIDSGVDFLAIVADDADRGTVADELRDVAYDVMLGSDQSSKSTSSSERSSDAAANKGTRSFEMRSESGDRSKSVPLSGRAEIQNFDRAERERVRVEVAERRPVARLL
jgi:hypothetical protein